MHLRCREKMQSKQARRIGMKSKRLDYIDALRGLAAVSVVLQHAAERIIAHDPDHSHYLRLCFIDAINAGRFGIGLFFLISGFVIPFSFKEPHALVKFCISRFFRLYPAYWLSIAAAVWILTAFAGAEFPARTILANITMLQTLLGEPGILGPYWTLIIELTFYGLCAVLFMTGSLADWKVLLAAFGALLFVSAALSGYGAIEGRYVSANLPLNLSFMFLGTLLRRAALEADGTLKRAMPAILGIAAISTALILFSAPDRQKEFYTASSFCVAYLSALLVFVLSVRSSRSLGATLTRIGIVSYSLYLFHDICLSVFERVLPPINGIGSHALFALAAAGSSIAVAVFVYYAVENPAVTLGRTVSTALSKFPLPNLVSIRGKRTT